MVANTNSPGNGLNCYVGLLQCFRGSTVHLFVVLTERESERKYRCGHVLRRDSESTVICWLESCVTRWLVLLDQSHRPGFGRPFQSSAEYERVIRMQRV